MKKLLTVAAVLSGYIFFEVLQYIVGYLAALAIPREYFLWFGKQHSMLALAIEEGFIIALPMFILSIAWSIFTNIIFGKNHLLKSTACLIGFFLHWIVTIFNTDINFMLVLSSMFQPYNILKTVAVPIGIFCAGFGLSKFSHTNQHQHLAQ